MKKTLTGIIGLTVFVMMIIASCVSSQPKQYKIFIGEWQRVDTISNKNISVKDIIIKKDDDAFVIISGKDKFSFAYDKNKNVLKNYFMQDTTTIKYIEKTDHIILTNIGDGGEFKRVH